jgi:transcription antitermination factor NusA-like protein
VGVRGNRIKNIVEELGGERIDIVRWSEDLQVLVPNALQPAEVDEVILVGGATRMPAVIEAIRERFGREPTCTFDPDEVVAFYRKKLQVL